MLRITVSRRTAENFKNFKRACTVIGVGSMYLALPILLWADAASGWKWFHGETTFWNVAGCICTVASGMAFVVALGVGSIFVATHIEFRTHEDCD